MTQGFLARHSQSEELEADRLGLGYTARADYDPRGMVRFFSRLLQASPDAPAFVAIFQSHPPTRARIEDARKRLRAMKVHGGDVGADRHQRIVRRLRALRKEEGAVDAGAP